MKRLARGEFFGQTNHTIHLDGLTLTDTVYTHDRVDWHYHEQAYFTFILEGAVIEGNKNETYECQPGSLLFHNWQEAHYNIKPPGFTRGFHLEIERGWFRDLGLEEPEQGSVRLDDPSMKLGMYRMAAEARNFTVHSGVSIQTLLVDLLSQMQGGSGLRLYKNPSWVGQLKQILHDAPDETHSLAMLSGILRIHPVHLSRDFPKYFHCTLGEYLRKLKIARAMVLLADKDCSLTTIAFDCGFADQSHFIRCFRQLNGMTPSGYRRLLFS